MGLKGTDHMVEEALRRGAKPRANERVRIALAELLELKDEIEILTYPGDMGRRQQRSWDLRPLF